MSSFKWPKSNMICILMRRRNLNTQVELPIDRTLREQGKGQNDVSTNQRTGEAATIPEAKKGAWERLPVLH